MYLCINYCGHHVPSLQAPYTTEMYEAGWRFSEHPNNQHSSITFNFNEIQDQQNQAITNQLPFPHITPPPQTIFFLKAAPAQHYILTLQLTSAAASCQECIQYTPEVQFHNQCQAQHPSSPTARLPLHFNRITSTTRLQGTSIQIANAPTLYIHCTFT